MQKFFNPRVLRDGSFQGINFNRFMVTERAIYLGEHIDFLVFLFKILFFKELLVSTKNIPKTSLMNVSSLSCQCLAV